MQVKLWTVDSGFCFVTFSEHTAPVTAVSFLPTSSAAVSASLDGTVRAWDLLRYRNFRTMTSPDPVQLASLAVDPAGEVLHRLAFTAASLHQFCCVPHCLFSGISHALARVVIAEAPWRNAVT